MGAIMILGLTTLPGLHWHMPFPLESVDKVNANAVDNYAYSTEMLTADEQYISIDMVVQYRRTDPVKYSFEVVEPELTLQDVTESALREVVGTSDLDTLIAARRDEIATRTRDVLQNTLDMYGAGLTVTSISLETVNYPQAVQAAVDNRAIALARQQKLAPPEDDAGGTGGMLSADEIVFDSTGRVNNAKGEQTTEGGSDAAMREIWLRQVQTRPADFLRSKFAYQHAMRSTAETD